MSQVQGPILCLQAADGSWLSPCTLTGKNKSLPTHQQMQTVKWEGLPSAIPLGHQLQDLPWSASGIRNGHPGYQLGGAVG